MKLVVDQTHLGTPEEAWRHSHRLALLPPIQLGRPAKVIVVAPHPDDEILGTGGLLQSVIASGIPIEFLAVTDGEGSHPQAAPPLVESLRTIRHSESSIALRRLGLSVPSIARLGLADGRVADVEDEVRHAVEAIAGPEDLVLAPWWLDGHPDHDACGRAAAAAALHVGARSLHYLVWAWHWADPERDDLPWARCRRFDFGRPSAHRKSWSIEAFDSQIRSWGPAPDELPVLPPAVLVRFHRTFEVFVEVGMP